MSAIPLVLALLGCASKQPGPPLVEVEALESKECADECQAKYSTCSAGCGQLVRISEIFEWSRRRTCLEGCKPQLENCYAACK